MKNAKKASGISYSSVAIILILTALAYGFYRNVSESRAEVRSTDILEHQVEQANTLSDDKALGLISEHKPEQKPSETEEAIEK